MKGERQRGSASGLVAGIGITMVNRAALRAGLRRRIDGWRRAAGLVLRGENATFVLSAFGIDVWSDTTDPASRDASATQSHLARRLAGFLANEPALHILIRKGDLEDRGETGTGASYTLRCEPAVAGPGRFVRPDHWEGEDRFPAGPRDGEPLLNFVCRVDAERRADVWVRVNHVGADGVPVQEMMTRLETAWGISEVLYPAPDAFAPFAGPRVCPGRAGCGEVQTFVDFAPLLAWRKKENAGLADPMTISAAMLWWLARHPALGAIHMGTTVEMAAGGGLARGVGVVVVRPADYVQHAGGLARYVRDFNRQMELTRRRATGRCRTLDAAALVRPGPAAAVLRHALRQGGNAFGSLGLTILKEARVFGAPLADVGHENGFIAVGSFGLPTTAGGRVGCVTIKGPMARIADYPRVLREAMRCADR